MKVFKFGGASVKDAAGVRNLHRVLKELGWTDTVVVISAMGKMTNALEEVVALYRKGSDNGSAKIEAVRSFHLEIIEGLGFKDPSSIIAEVDAVIADMQGFMRRNMSDDYDFVYDQVVSRGELMSTKICSAYLAEKGMDNHWLDVRTCIRTNSDFRRARVDWEATCSSIREKVQPGKLTITQGFLGMDQYGKTTTLGREGSDYTAGILAYCLEASEVSIFKDVPGVLNADPRAFEQTTLLEAISYKEAIEMAFFGASVIHPKTLQPLQRKRIPLRVRSFVHPADRGTIIEEGLAVKPQMPCFIVKNKQILLSISDKEFHFVMEEDISEIFALLHRFKMKVNLIQNSAISFSVCVEDNFDNFDALLSALGPKYKVLYNKGLTLFTIRHFDDEALGSIERNREVLLKQMSRETAQIILKNESSNERNKQ